MATGVHPVTDEPNLTIRNISTLVTMEPTMGHGKLGILHGATIHASGGTISSIETAEDVRLLPDARRSGSAGAEIDATGLIAIPGLVNAHHHLYQSILRGLGANEDLVGWFQARAPFLERYTSTARFHAVRLSLLECIGSGVTTVFEFASNTRNQGDVEQTLRAAEQLPVRMVLGYQPPPGDPPSLASVITLCGDHPAIERLFCIPGAVIPERNDDAQFARFTSLVEQARRDGLGIATHALEHRKERDNGSLRVLQDVGALGPDTVLAHCIHLMPSDIEVLARTNTRAVYNPMSNMRLGSGIMPLSKLHEAHICVALGSDGATADSGDFFSAMRSGIGLQRALHQTPEVCSYERILRMATIEGAEALGLSEKIGSIAVGKCADLVLIDPNAANFACGIDPVAQVVFSAQPRNVHTVILRGKPVLRNGAVMHIDADEIVAGAAQAAQQIAGSL
ncbi:MAG: hypothetical protein EA403_01880 [Spirochaetaceae bacterium]|nr:MAG: hypothetical protein EA403_01880 [Spirochaetaceae bacterium]